jgi:uncharacterized lipoprotein YmbA
MRYTMKAIRLFLLFALIALAGCFSLSREEPPLQHYVLGGGSQPENRTPARNLAGLTIGLRQVQVAEYLETPLIVVRQGPRQIKFSEFHRWAEDLGGGVNRAVAGYLALRAPFQGVDVVPWPSQAQHDYLIQLHLLCFEGVAPEEPAASEGEAHLLATWEIIRQQGGVVLTRGTTDYRAQGWMRGDYDGLVALLDTGLRELSDDLVASLETLVAL